MFPVQVLVVLSTMIIFNHAATLKHENQTSGAASYEADKMAYEINKTYISNGNYSQTTRPYYFNATDLIENFDFSKINATDIFEYTNNSNETALPVLKSSLLNVLFKDFSSQVVKDIASNIVTSVGTKLGLIKK